MVNSISSQIKQVIFQQPHLRASPEEIQKCADVAKEHLQTLPSHSSRVTKAIRYAAHSFLIALERFLMKLGLIHLFQKVVSPEEIDAKGQDMILLSTIFSTLTTTLIPVLGAYHGGMMIGGVFMLLLSLSFTYPLWRPLPSCMPRVENWTEMHLQGDLEVGFERKDLLDRIARSLGRSPLLIVGEEGSGKTELVRELVKSIEDGNYPEFSGCQLFYVNTADLISHNDWLPNSHSPLSYLSEAVAGHRDKIIFVFDQIHLACRSKGTLAEQFKMMLDSSKIHFPKLIGIANLEEMNVGFIHRFRQIKLSKPPRSEIVKILSSVLLKSAPDMLVSEDAYNLIAEKSPNLRQAVDLLRRCMEKVSPQFSEERRLLWEMKQQMYSLSLNMTDEKAFAALHQVLIPSLEQKLISNAKAAGCSIVLNAEIVERELQDL